MPHRRPPRALKPDPATVRGFPSDPRARMMVDGSIIYVILDERVPESAGTSATSATKRARRLLKRHYLGRVVNGTFYTLTEYHHLFSRGARPRARAEVATGDLVLKRERLGFSALICAALADTPLASLLTACGRAMARLVISLACYRLLRDYTGTQLGINELLRVCRLPWLSRELTEEHVKALLSGLNTQDVLKAIAAVPSSDTCVKAIWYCLPASDPTHSKPLLLLGVDPGGCPVAVRLLSDISSLPGALPQDVALLICAPGLFSAALCRRLAKIPSVLLLPNGHPLNLKALSLEELKDAGAGREGALETRSFLSHPHIIRAYGADPLRLLIYQSGTADTGIFLKPGTSATAAVTTSLPQKEQMEDALRGFGYLLKLQQRLCADPGLDGLRGSTLEIHMAKTLILLSAVSATGRLRRHLGERSARLLSAALARETLPPELLPGQQQELAAAERQLPALAYLCRNLSAELHADGKVTLRGCSRALQQLCEILHLQKACEEVPDYVQELI